MTEIRLGLWLGILSTLSLLALNWGCADAISRVARPGAVEESTEHRPLPPQALLQQGR